jgi:hypothetical protein
VKLIDLDPRWVGAGGAGVARKDPATGEQKPVPERHGVGISFKCPCGRSDYDNGHTPRVCVEFDKPLDGGSPHRTDGHVWQRTGETFETLTLTPSIQRVGGCAWHGWITNGEVTSC